MTTLEDLVAHQRVFIRVEWPESQTVEEQWWFKQQGFQVDNGEYGESGIVMAPINEYIKWRNKEDVTYVYPSLSEAKDDFDTILEEIIEIAEINGEINQELAEDLVEEASDFFENKSGFRTPELIPYFN